MKRKSSLRLPASRWLAYSVASAATACALGQHPAEGAIHYSGPVDAKLPAYKDGHVTFQLDQPGDSIFFERLETAPLFRSDFAGFKVNGKESGAFSGAHYKTYRFVYALNRFSRVGHRGLAHCNDALSGFGTLANRSFSGYFLPRGPAYVGFVFNGGAGKQYGWARVFMRGFEAGNSFIVLDYAYADPGEQIKAGQTSEDKSSSGAEESLGALAFGAAGLVAWRRRRVATN